ncbi:hypothetical protein M2D63_017845 [Pseudomonas sp. BJa5]|uniref:hypothetical protein n=1 Tax=Pseudomonas sp. BJa5 TaxID=2936270 RepID=UPI00255A17BA|nr:hypothetical protein [Pseudomonas sp. BGr12]MDL2422981.1 hypothetical protein [Pseudomonas sp. BGr12]
MPTANQTIADAVASAQSILAKWIPPEGISSDQALNELMGVLDNRRLVAAQRVQAGPYNKGVDPKQLDKRFKVTFDLLYKYGVLVDPESLDDEVVERLYPRVNYPRLASGSTLLDWSDAVLGEGQQVRFYLPQSPRRNTHLATVRFLSGEARSFIGELIQAVEIEGEPGEASTKSAFDAQDEDYAPDLSDHEQPDFALNEEAEAITAGGQRGLNTLHSLLEVGEENERWSPAVLASIEKLLEQHDGDEEIDTLEAMTQLVDRVDLMVRKAREVLDRHRAQPA